MDRLERLEAIEAIRQLKARYFRLMDIKDWDALRDVFTADMQVVTPEGTVYAYGGDAYVASLRQSLEHAVSSHQGLTAEIEVIDGTTAKGVWAMQDAIEWAQAHPRTGWKAILGRGHYHETYERGSDDFWRIGHLTLTRIRLDITWPEGKLA